MLGAAMLMREVTEHHNQQLKVENRISREKIRPILKMMSSLLDLMKSHEDIWNGMVYDDSDQKKHPSSLMSSRKQMGGSNALSPNNSQMSMSREQRDVKSGSSQSRWGKNIITSLSHQELFGLTATRVKFIKFYCEVSMLALEYD
jgi:hypothetical protein